jgi:hypothetical protein
MMVSLFIFKTARSKSQRSPRYPFCVSLLNIQVFEHPETTLILEVAGPLAALVYDWIIVPAHQRATRV